MKGHVFLVEEKKLSVTNCPAKLVRECEEVYVVSYFD